MIKRQFSKELYDAHDTSAKNALIAILEADGHIITNVEENFYADVESTKNGVTYYNEAEVKRAWTGDWPPDWKEVRIPQRKSRLLKKYNGNVNFYVFRNDLAQCWHIKGEQLTEESLATARGRYIVQGEQFFHIPYKEAKLIDSQEEKV
jgi:hypothetical protein